MDCGSWIFALTPVYYPGEQLYAVLGFGYDETEWISEIYRKMLPNIMIILMIWGLIITLIGIHSRQKQLLRYSTELRESERSKASYLSHIVGMAYRCKNDQYWTMEYVSEGCFDLTGYQPESLIYNKKISYNDLIAKEQQEPMRQEWDRILERHLHFRGEYQITTRDGEIKWVAEYGHGVYREYGSVEALEGIIFDITDRKISEEQVSFLQEHDLLTGLYNRFYMERELRLFDTEQNLPLTIMICDIDGLRLINNAYGHNIGDYVIGIAAKIIQQRSGKKGIVANMGAGEFMVLLPNTNPVIAEGIRKNIKAAVLKHNADNIFASHELNLSVAYETRKTMEISIDELLVQVEENLKKRKLLARHSAYSATVSSIMATLYAKNHKTEEHGLRLGLIAKAIGEKMGLNVNDLADLRLLGQLHDIGKIGVDDRILNKPGELTSDEWEQMKKHPLIKHNIVTATPQLSHIANYILTHHERFDGTGYPAGLAGEEIPLISRILAVADAYDAMTEARVYREALSEEVAINEIKTNSGTQFDPEVVAVFVKLLEENKHSF